ncbi:MAG: protein kinase [Gemmatimonadota bacterium]
MLEQLREATLGDYEILAELGSGGMATVYLAHDLQLDRRVAIKLMHPALISGEGMAERFILEARTAAGLSHPNIIPIYAVRVDEDLLFFVMKFVEGRPLDSIIAKEAPLPAEMVRQIVSLVAEALGYAHHRGVIHRDIKPANIMISTEGQPILADFGIAKVADKQGLTLTGATIGTPTYMSPEQCNALPLTGASDQYSLGVMAYEMLTGRPPFDADSIMTIMFKHINDPPSPVLERVKDCPPDLAITIERMLSKDPADRFPEMGEVARALKTPTITSENKVRTQLVQFALAGSNRDVLKRVSTPRSPIPSGISRLKTRAAAGKVAPPASHAVAEPRGRRTGLMAGAVGLATLGFVLAVAQPWKSRTAGIPDAPPAVESTGVDSLPTVTDSVASPVSRPPAPADTEPPVTKQPATPQLHAAPRPAPVATAATVATVRVQGPVTLSIGENAVLQAESRDAQGQTLAGHRASWVSSSPEVVSVSASGQILARDAGRATITGTVDGISHSITVTVPADALAEVSLKPSSVSLLSGDSITLAISLRSAAGRNITRPVTWNSSAPSIATVSNAGVVVGHSVGTATITATSENEHGAATITVGARAPTEAELRAQVANTVQAYANALESRNIARVRELYPGMPAAREQQLRVALPDMKDLQVHLTVGQVDISASGATARVTGSWIFNDGRRNTLPADNTYQLERRAGGWVITDIR